MYFAEDSEVKALLAEVSKGSDVFVCDLSLAELYYKTCEEYGRDVAELRYVSIRDSVKVVATDERLTRDAGALKCQLRGKVSLADAYVLAVAKMIRGTLVTTDHLISESHVVRTRLIHLPKS